MCLPILKTPSLSKFIRHSFTNNFTKQISDLLWNVHFFVIIPHRWGATELLLPSEYSPYHPSKNCNDISVGKVFIISLMVTSLKMNEAIRQHIFSSYKVHGKKQYSCDIHRKFDIPPQLFNRKIDFLLLVHSSIPV